MSSDAIDPLAPAALDLIRARTHDLLHTLQTSTLPNGARLHVLPSGKHGVACLEVWARVGSGDEPPRMSGISHLLEHLMFRGTHALPDGEFDELVEALGVQANAWTWYDTTAYTAILPSEALQELMEVEADRLQNLNITDEVFTTEREVVLNERSLTADSDPNALAQEHLDVLMFGVSPYAHPVIGSKEDIAAFTREDALAWYRAHYAPDQLDIIVTGDVDPAAVATMARATFGALPPHTHPRAPRPTTNPTTVGVEETVALGVAEPRLMIAWPLPPRSDAHGTARWKLLAELLTFGRGGYLRGVLEYDERLVLEQQFYVNEHRLGHSALWEATPRDGITTTALADAFFGALARFAEAPVDAASMDAARLRLLTYLSARSTPWHMARAIGAALHDAGDIQSLLADLDALEAVTAHELQELAQSIADRRSSVILHVVPQ